MMTPEIRSDLIKHSDEYVHALMTDKEASKYMLKLYNFLAEMQPGQRMNLRADGEKLRWMLVTVGEFMRSEGHWRCYDLNADYTQNSSDGAFPRPAKKTWIIATLYYCAYGRVCSVMEHTRPFSILPASCKDT